jgi:chromosome segregation ATPase
MGYPSLFEDNLEKQVDNLLRDNVGDGKFFTRAELRECLRHLGITAIDLFRVDDQRLAQEFQDCVEESRKLREKIKYKNKEIISLQRKLDKDILYLEFKKLLSDNDQLREKIRKLNEEMCLLKRDLDHLRSEKSDLEDRYSELKNRYTAQQKILKDVQAENRSLKSKSIIDQKNLGDCQKSRDQLERELSRCRAALAEFHKQEMRKIIGE